MQLEACSISLANKPNSSRHEISFLPAFGIEIKIDDFPSWNCPQCHGWFTVMDFWLLDITRLLAKFSFIAQLIFASIVSEKIKCACYWESTPVSSNWPDAENSFGSANGAPCKWPAINLHIVRG